MTRRLVARITAFWDAVGELPPKLRLALASLSTGLIVTVGEYLTGRPGVWAAVGAFLMLWGTTLGKETGPGSTPRGDR